MSDEPIVESADVGEAERGINEGATYRQYRKAIVAVIGAIVAFLATQGIDVDPSLVTGITTILTALAVYAVPNEG